MGSAPLVEFSYALDSLLSLKALGTGLMFFLAHRQNYPNAEKDFVHTESSVGHGSEAFYGKA